MNDEKKGRKMEGDIMMNDEELEKLIKSNIPKIHTECNSKELFQKCKIQKVKHNNQIIKYLFSICCCAILCFITASITITIVNYNKNYNNALNVDMGKTTYLSREGLSEKLYEAAKMNNPNWEPIFDKMIAFGPDNANGTIKLSVINKSDLLSSEDKQTLIEYETSIKETYPNHLVNFQIAFGIKDNKDYIYLIDYCGYDEKLKKAVYNEFLLESNLKYSFESLVSEFETKTGKEMTSDFLNSAYYDDQNLLSSGIIIGFIEVNGFYQEYYYVKLDGEVFVNNKK